MACKAAPGLQHIERTSSWPVRNQRRHEATAAFNSPVLVSLAQLVERVQSVEDRLSRDLNQKMDQVLAELEVTSANISAMEGSTAEFKFDANTWIEDRSTTFPKLASMVEIKGKKVESLRRPCVEVRDMPGADLREPDSEGSPSKGVGIDAGHSARSLRCDLFDISNDDEEAYEEEYEKDDCANNDEAEDFIEESGPLAKPRRTGLGAGHHLEECDAILQPSQGSWQRLVYAELALSRLARLREIFAAPASARAMIGRIDGHYSSDEDEEDGTDALASVVQVVAPGPELKLEQVPMLQKEQRTELSAQAFQGVVPACRCWNRFTRCRIS